MFFLVAVAVLFPFLIAPDALIWPNSGFDSDITQQAWPELAAFGEALRAGRLDLWDGATALGFPQSGKLGALWLYPLTLLFALIPPAYAFTLMSLAHLTLMGVLMFFLFLALFPEGRWGALFSGLAFMLMPKTIAHLAGGHHNLVAGMVWLPAVLLFAYRSFKTAAPARSYQYALLSGLALAMQIPAHPQITLGTIYLLLALTLWLMGKNFKFPILYWKFFATRLFWIGGTAALVGMVWWLPFLALYPSLTSIEFDSFFRFWYQMPPGMVLNLLFPTEFQFPEWTVYSGIGVVIFVGVAAWKSPRRRFTLPLLGLVALAVLLALGDQTPIYGIFERLVPGTGFFRTRTRFWFFGGFALALLAGHGLEVWLWQSKAQGGRLKLLFVGYTFLVAAGGAGLGWLAGDFPTNLARSALSGSLILLVLAVDRGRIRWERWRYGVVLAGLLLLDLVPGARAYMRPVIPAETFLKPDPVAEYIAARYAEEGTPHERLYVEILLPTYSLLRQLNLDTLNGVLNFQLAGGVQIIHLATGCTSTGYSNRIPACLEEAEGDGYISTNPDAALLGMLNVRYIVARAPMALPTGEPAFVELLGQADIPQGEGTWLYEVSPAGVLPRAFIVQEVREVDAAEGTAFGQLAAIEPAQTALVPHGSEPTGLSGTPVSWEIAIIEQSPGAIRLTVQSSRTALLVYSEAYAPGWRATVNGAGQAVHQVNGALLGFVVPEGASEVRLVYRPLSWVVGASVSLLSILVAAVVLAWFQHRESVG